MEPQELSPSLISSLVTYTCTCMSRSRAYGNFLCSLRILFASLRSEVRNLRISSEAQSDNNDCRRCVHGQDGSPSRWSKTISRSHLSANECLFRRPLASSYEHPASNLLDSGAGLDRHHMRGH